MKIYEPGERTYNSVYTTQCKPDILKIMRIMNCYGYSYIVDYFDHFIYTYDSSDVFVDIDEDGKTISMNSELTNVMDGATKSYHIHHLGNRNAYSHTYSLYMPRCYTKKMKVKLGWGSIR